jgi:hypothetical protein
VAVGEALGAVVEELLDVLRSGVGEFKEVSG